MPLRLSGWGANGESERELPDVGELFRVLAEDFGLANLNEAALERRLSGVFVQP